MLAKGKIISVKNQNHHPAHPCKDSKSKDSYKRSTVASEVPPILISRRKDQPSFNLEGGRGISSYYSNPLLSFQVLGWGNFKVT
jgi:hypothetical protein